MPFSAKMLRLSAIIFQNFSKTKDMTKSPSTLGIILFAATMIIFFVVYYFFSGVDYFDTTLKVNAFVLPVLYAGTAFWSVKSYWNNHRTVSFKQAFKRAFVPMFIGGILSIASIYAYLNFVDPDAKKLLNYQYVQRQKAELDKEYTSTRTILKHQKDIDELDQKYKERVQSFSPDAVKGKDMLTASHFSGYFAAILIFYVVLSLFFGAFFRTRTVYQENSQE